MKFNPIKSFSQKRNVKYGTVTMAFCAIVIALVIIFNSIISVFAENNEWYFDMTEERLFTVSDQMAELLKTATGEKPIHIIFCGDQDKLAKDYDDNSATKAYDPAAYVHSTALQLSRRLSNVSVLYKHSQRDHQFHKDNGWGAGVNENVVIVAMPQEDGTYGTQYRLYSMADFYSYDENGQLYGYDGEYKFATAVLSLQYKQSPVVYYVTNHGEESKDVGNFIKLFVDSGFEVRLIDLMDKAIVCKNQECKKEYFPNNEGEKSFVCAHCKTECTIEECLIDRTAVPTDASLIIINKPTLDYDDREIEMIENFLNGFDNAEVEKGSVMCFINQEVWLTNLYGFLQSWAGVIVHTDLVTDDRSSVIGSLNSFRGSISSTNAANTYLSDLVNMQSVRPIFKNSGYLTIEKSYNADEGNITGVGERGTQSLFTTSDSAVAGGKSGKYTVMTATYSSNMKGETTFNSYLICCASSDFVSDSYVMASGASVYPNKNIVLSLTHQITAKQTAVSLDTKPFYDYTLDISQNDASMSMMALILVPLFITVALMTVVIIWRKRR